MNLNSIKFRKHEIKNFIIEYKSGILKFDQLPVEFHKFIEQINKIPEKPIEPDVSECCGSGCTPCVMDIYEERLNDYEDKINELYKKINMTTD